MWMSWLRMKADFDSKIVVSNAKHREKNIEDYQMRLALAFKEMHRVLKRGRCMSVAFNSWDDEAWNAFLSSCCDLGFEVVDVTPIRYSANSVMQDSREGGLRGDFVMTFRKQLERKSGFNVIAFLNDLKPQFTVTPSKMTSDNKG
jgi:adenine-specific DNA methylase